MQCLAVTAGFFSSSWLLYPPVVIAPCFFNILLRPIFSVWTRHMCRNEEALWPSSHRTSYSIKLSGDNRWQKEADAEVSGRGGVQCPHLTYRERWGEGWGYENDWWEHKWQSCDREERGGGGVKGDEGQRWQLSGPTCPPISRFPSWFASPRRDTCRGRPGKQEQVS